MLHNKFVKSICLICSMYFLEQAPARAQNSDNADTLRLDIRAAEKQFLEKNLSLLAQHYNVEAGKALIQQAKLWDNPVLNTDQNVYSDGQWFHHGTNANGDPTGQVFVQVQQLIKTAGKRGKQVNMARTSAELNEWQFRDVMRNLRYQLRKDFYTVLQLQGNRRLYAQEKEQLDILIKAMTAELQAGNIAQKDLLRIQALDVNLQHEVTENAKNISDIEAELKTLLQVTGDVFVQPVADDDNNTHVPNLSIVQLVDSARQYNTDYMQQLLQVRYQKQNLSYQRALAVPDLTFGPEFDQNSNYTPNYYGLGISLPLPVLNRNQGNIKSARWQVKQEEANLQQIDDKLQNDVKNAYQKLLYTLQLSSGGNEEFYRNYYRLYDNIVQSYKQRRISMLEFIDYFNGYESIREQELQQKLNVRLAKEELNYEVGMDVTE
ncbi:MAG: TolC family protein [Bacteroidetes bacterium]|nr:TolC family protein [Bacteroidota bacterium]